jgi:DNA-binding transcriptional ArsR family regulator
LVDKGVRMKTVKKASQILKCLADSTRLRIVNLLTKEELNVNALCHIMDKKQSIVSKHLAQLRLLDIVGVRKEGLNAYYYLQPSKHSNYNDLLKAITVGFTNLELIRKDTGQLKKINSNK